MVIKTFKIKHSLNFSKELEYGYFVACEAVKAKQLKQKRPSTKPFDKSKLHSHIINQVIGKYFKNKNIKNVNKRNIKLMLSSQDLKFDKEKKILKIVALKHEIKNFWFNLDQIEKFNYVEFDNNYFYIAATIKPKQIQQKISKHWIGIDLNSTSHSVVLANSKTGNVKKFGKEIPFLKKKYKNLRAKAKTNKELIKRLSKNESNKTKDLLQKITTKIVNEASKTQVGIKIENLKGISKKNTIKFQTTRNHSLNSWPFYKFQQMLVYKCYLQGIPIKKVDPGYTSQTCYKCKNLGTRNGKVFECACGHLEHADSNAAFNISIRD